MPNNIYTPVTLWKDFDSSLPLNESVIKELKYDGISYTQLYFSGRETGMGRVRIYALMSSLENSQNKPSILILPDYNKTVDMELSAYFVKKGYNVLMLDYSGEQPNKERYTIYPKNIEYANFIKSERKKDFVDATAKETSWYEWVAVAKYGVKYLRKISGANKIGVLGLRHGGEIMWQLIAGEPVVDCAISLFGSGWEAYQGIYKYGETSELSLSDERHRYIAGVDAHAYAPYAKCPVMLLTSTNERHFDIDRVFDTIARVNPKVSAYANFSVRYDGFLGSNSLDDIDIFFNRYLKNEDISLPKNMDASIELQKNEYIITAVLDDCENVVSCEAYYSDGTIIPGLRDWIKAKELPPSCDKRQFSMQIYNKSEYVFALVKAEYKNKFTISSKIVAQRIEKPVKNMYPKSRVIYTSKSGKDGFTVKDPENLIGEILFESDNYPLTIVNGPFDIKGIYSKYGLKSYRVGSKRYRAHENAALKFDCWTKTYNTIIISVYTNYLTPESKEYRLETNLKGGDIWQSLMLTSSEFKSMTGQPLKCFSEIDIIIFEGKTEFALNNIIWI